MALFVLSGVAAPPPAAAGVSAVSFAAPESVTGYDFGGGAIGDLDGDGRDDIAAATTSYPPGDATANRLYLFPQQPDGSIGAPMSWRTHEQAGAAAGVAAADLNGDGHEDVAVGTDRGVDVFTQAHGTLDRTDSIPVPYGAVEVVAAHLLGDGRTDLAVSSGSGVRVISNLGHGAWAKQRIWDEPVKSIAVGDLTGDGRRDVALFRWKHLIVVAQRPDGTFENVGHYTPASHQSAGWAIAIGDVTGDGRNDVVLTMNTNVPAAGIEVFAGREAGLAPPTVLPGGDAPEAISLNDLNADGRRDVVVFHDGGDVGVYLQQSDGTLGAESLTSIPPAQHYPRQSGPIGDVNGDGRPDVVAASGDLVILRQA
jgi:hypothetical protein